MKRWEILDYLREVLRACGDSMSVEMVVLKAIPENSGIDDKKYRIEIAAALNEATLACLKPLNEQYGIEMKQESGHWIFTKNKEGSKRVTSAASIT